MFDYVVQFILFCVKQIDNAGDKISPVSGYVSCY